MGKKKIGKLLRKKREKCRLSKEKLSQFSGVNEELISAVESGRSYDPEAIEKIAKVLRLNLKLKPELVKPEEEIEMEEMKIIENGDVKMENKSFSNQKGLNLIEFGYFLKNLG